MNIILLLVLVAVGFFVIERLWPAGSLPEVKGWWARIALLNLVQVGVVLLAGYTWDRWFQSASLFHLSKAWGDVPAALTAYLLSCIIYYWWHRIRHESQFFWRLCHQLHHSPRRIELLTSFYKHPVEITINSLLSSAIVYALLGCSLRAAAIYTVIIAIAEYFYHWNINTPRWLGWFIQRPESHRVHHQRARHTSNYADLPFIDWLFGTLFNPKKRIIRCGFESEQEQRVPEMLVFRDVDESPATPPVHGLQPTCFGCRKRWACAAARREASKPACDSTEQNSTPCV
jgi:sterol desaturase/sphingolipid hydroxylase (fatty acid hydroxylase superfamily)